MWVRLKPNRIFADNVSTDNVSADNVSTDNVSADNVSADNVMKALGEQSLEASPGRLAEENGQQSQAFKYILKYNGRFTKKEDYENIIIKSAVGGQMLRLKDIASIEFGKV